MRSVDDSESKRIQIGKEGFVLKHIIVIPIDLAQRVFGHLRGPDTTDDQAVDAKRLDDSIQLTFQIQIATIDQYAIYDLRRRPGNALTIGLES